ncbi:MAG: hypothetical protein ACYCYI_14060 [Saccharofermentanales bacterium]
MKRTIIGSALFIGGILLLCGDLIGKGSGFFSLGAIIIGLMGLCILTVELFVKDDK